MKIGILIKNYAIGKEFDKSGVPNKSGAEFHAENHAKLFLEAGHDCYVMTKKTYFFTKSTEIWNGVPVVRLHAPFRWLEIIVRQLTTHRDTDCFYIIGIPKFAVWAILMGKLLGKSVTLALTSKSEIFNRNENWRTKILASCDNYIANSTEMAEGLEKEGGVSRDKINVLPHGIDTRNRFYPVDNEHKQELREKFGLAKDAFVVLFCARVVPNKGIDTMLKAWEIVHSKNKNAFLLVVGGGFNDLLEKIKSTGERLDNSILSLGEVPKADNYYRLSDMYLFPSWFEGLPTSLMEAMASGLPAAASKIGGVEDLIFNNETGILVDSQDYEGFAEAILRLGRDVSLREELGNNARKFAVNNLDCHKLLPRLLDIIK